MDVDERRLFGDAVTSAIAGHAPDDLVDAVRADGWAELVADDEATACGVLFERAGRACSSAPVLDLAVALDETARPALALGRDDPAATDGAGLRLDAVLLGGPAERVLVGYPELGNPDGRVAVVATDALRGEQWQGLDPDLRPYRVHGEVPADALVDVPGLTHTELLAQLRRCTAHLLVGLGQGVTDLAQQHVTDRAQFGSALATRQTVAHRLADVHVELAAARATLDAAWDGRDPLLAAVAKSQAGTAAVTAVDVSQQLFGAMGFTWEHEAHRFVRRVYLLDALLGSASELHTEIGTHLLADRTLEPAHVAF